MYKKNRVYAFTLVELIVVLTILAILSTLGFVAYVDYLKGVRDASRIQQMTSLHDAIVLYGSRASIPLSSSNGISILAGSGTIGYQGYIDQSFRDVIRYADGGVDPKTKQDFTYFVSPDRKYAQILGYFEERNSVNLSFVYNGYANDIDYSSLNPKVTGAKLGVIIEEDTHIPIQDYDNSFDILSSIGSYKSIISENDTLVGEGIDLVGMIPGSSCEKILDTLGTAESKIYKINPDGTGQFDVYCDMQAGGGGWTFGGYIAANARNADVFFNAATGNYDANRGMSSSTYSIDISKLFHTEMIVLFNESDISTAEASDNLLRFKYDLFTPGFYLGPLVLPNGNAFFGGGDETGLSYSTSSSGSMIPTNRDRFGGAGWGIGSNSPDIQYLIRIATGNSGVYRYEEAWGIGNSSSSGNAAYIYVR